MKTRYFFRTRWLGGALLALLTTTAFAQKQPYVTNIRVQVDTLGKLVRFTYDLPKVQPDDSLFIQMETPDKVFFLKAVEGEIGRNLSPGTDRTFYWSPLADRRQIDADVKITFKVRTYVLDTLQDKRRGLLLTKQQLITYGRWGVSAALTGILVAKSVGVLRNIRTYKNDAPPINALEKVSFDQRQADLTDQKRRLYPWVAASAVSLLANAAYSYILKNRPPRKPPRVSWQGSGTSVGLAYGF